MQTEKSQLQNEETSAFIIETVSTLLRLTGVVINGVTEDRDAKTGSLRYAISTPESLLLIGEGGARLLALNHLMKRIVEKKFGEHAPQFMLDINDYQKKQVDEIRAKAHMLAERARYFKSTVEMDPMSSYERMIVHAEFTDASDISTESIGYGKERKDFCFR